MWDALWRQVRGSENFPCDDNDRVPISDRGQMVSGIIGTPRCKLSGLIGEAYQPATVTTAATGAVSVTAFHLVGTASPILPVAHVPRTLLNGIGPMSAVASVDVRH